MGRLRVSESQKRVRARAGETRSGRFGALGGRCLRARVRGGNVLKAEAGLEEDLEVGDKLE